MEYQEKQALKLERYQELQNKAERKSQEAYNNSTRLSEAIPFGQPILVGHHSETRHRRDIERIHNNMNKSIELKKKAEYYKNKIDNILNPNSINSDNPEALNLLKEKLKGLEDKREKAKELKKNDKDIPSWFFSNLSQNIRSVKERINNLEVLKQIPKTEKTINGITLKTDKDDNRVKLFFPSIPSEEIRTKLKQNGFKWSPLNKAWQRQLNNRALYIAEEILSKVL